jgi:hypothetical protein
MPQFYQRWLSRAKKLVIQTTCVEVRRTTHTEVTVEVERKLWQVSEYDEDVGIGCPLCGNALSLADSPGTLCPHNGEKALKRGHRAAKKNETGRQKNSN